MQAPTSASAIFPNCKASTLRWKGFWRCAKPPPRPPDILQAAEIDLGLARERVGHASFVTKGLKLLTLLDVLATFRLRVFSLAAVLTQEAPRTGILHGV